MQSHKDNIPSDFKIGNIDELSEEAKRQMLSGEADRVVIAEMPKKGKEIEINGIKFIVQQITKSGNIILEPQGRE